MRLVRWFYAIVGLVAAGYSASSIVARVITALGGDELMLDRPQLYIGLLLGAVVLAAAWQIGRPPPRWGAIVAAGAVAAFALSLVPVSVIATEQPFVDRPVGIIEIMVGGVPILTAVVSAAVLWRTWRSAALPAQPRP